MHRRPLPALACAMAGLILASATRALGPAVPEGADVTPPTRDYFVYVCSESEDQVTLVHFGPQGTSVEKTIEVGSFPAEIEGPHGINVSADGRFWYVSIAHGFPFGSVHKFATGTNEWLGSAKVGMFPATLDIAASTGLLYVVNSDFFGEHKPSSISVIETGTMTEVAQIPTGSMPHGARLSADGAHLYSVNMVDDTLMDVDALGFEVARTLDVSPAAIGMSGDDAPPQTEPSWVTPPTANGRLYVAGLSANRILEVDAAGLELERVLGPTGKGPYNIAVAPNGVLLVVTYKKGDQVGFWDLRTGRELARVDTTRRIPHGVAITPDGRYSFVTVEGVGGEPGTVEVFDNASLHRAGSVEVGKQAGGIAVWDWRGR